MVNPVTVNAGIIVPLTGADVDTWGTLDVNPNMVAIDGMLCGVQTIPLTNAPVTLTAPAGFVPTPSPGPVQSQNRVLRFTGVLTADVRVTLPIPGVYVIDNRCTGLNFALTLQGVTPTEVLGIPQGSCLEVYNDGANVRFVNAGKSGELEFWGAMSAMPSWVTQSTVKPYLWCDGTIYNAVDFPALFNQYGGNFGGNGVTTFGVQDLSGRVPLAWDKTGARITVAGCGINGQTMGASLDQQTVTIARNHLPNVSVGVTITDPGHVHTLSANHGSTANQTAAPDSGNQLMINTTTNTVNSATTGITAAFNLNGAVTQIPLNNVQPSLVSGLWVVKT